MVPMGRMTQAVRDGFGYTLQHAMLNSTVHYISLTLTLAVSLHQTPDGLGSFVIRLQKHQRMAKGIVVRILLAF